MAVYAIGDIQGCYEDLVRLLDKLHFNPAHDKLWLVGDLVSRGPDSLSTLRYLMSMGDALVTVLGNHDLHLLAVDAGIKTSKDPGLLAIIDADDRHQLINWLRQHPLIHHDNELGYTMVHAGIYPQWTLQQAQTYAHELERVLSGDQHYDFLEHMYGNSPVQWSDDLNGWDRLRFICNSFTRMRFCNEAGMLDLDTKGAIGTQAESFLPWYDIPQRKTRDLHIIFGHWSTLCLTVNAEDQKQHNVYPIDTGCVWGGKLTALRIVQGIKKAEPEYIHIDCPAHREAALS